MSSRERERRMFFGEVADDCSAYWMLPAQRWAHVSAAIAATVDAWPNKGCRLHWPRHSATS